MTALTRLNNLDSRAWSTATWSAPFVTQLVLALVIVTSWLLGKWHPGTNGAILFLISAAVVFVLGAVLCAALTRSASARARGLALSLAGSFAVVLVGGLVYGLWILAW
ncbi:hypothetical protein MLIT_33170 [Mycolicibacterium litorale]|uniref:Uncharacterized protein n=1 Tax=Mycolicibacterium litorale TaxID=758802 RepID=A0AAD1IL48_9MYCO|nr:hypothetical protein BCL50_1875 [Mycolicibacterium litorale]BBY17725.1 hypothetical protein MLIT_33170 [Mycolicibacterium litorale]